VVTGVLSDRLLSSFLVRIRPDMGLAVATLGTMRLVGIAIHANLVIVCHRAQLPLSKLGVNTLRAEPHDSALAVHYTLLKRFFLIFFYDFVKK